MDRLRSRMIERTLWALWVLLIGGAAMWVLVGSVGYWVRLDWVPDDTAAWVQAGGTLVAIVVSIVLASHQYRQTRRDKLRSEYSQGVTALSHASFAFGAVSKACQHLSRGYEDVSSARRVISLLEDARENLRLLPLLPDYGCATAIAEVKRCLVDAIGMVGLEIERPGFHGKTARPEKLRSRADDAFEALKSAFAEYSVDLGPGIYDSVIRAGKPEASDGQTISEDRDED